MATDPAAVSRLAADYTAAWNTGSAEAVAAHYAENGWIVINRGDPYEGRSGVETMAREFLTSVPDLSLTCDGIRCAGDHVIYQWTFTGHDATTGKPLIVRGWEEWDIDADHKVNSSRGWFDAEDYARQVAGR